MKILFIDHDDSFSHNIINVFRAKNCHVDFVSHQILRYAKTKPMLDEYQMIIFSPGPGSPADYPHSVEFYKTLPNDIAVLGVCLGHQLMLYAHGAKINQIAKNPVHGRQILLNTTVMSPLLGTMKLLGTIVLYHSLGVFETDSKISTWYKHIVHDHVCLMVEHRLKPHIGVQFHPESFASTIGIKIFNKIIRLLK